MRTTPVVLLLVLSTALAGCGGRSGPPPETGTGGGTVQGRVVDSSEAPVVGATVKVLLSELATETDASGDFALRGIPIGTVRLVASKDGYSTSTRTGELSRSQTLFFHFTLAEVRVPVAYNRTLPFNGEILCGLPTGTSCAALQTDLEPHRFDVEPSLRGMVLELQWTKPSQGVAEQLAFDLHAATPEACGDKYAGAEGASVVKLVVRDGFPLTGGHQCVVVRPTADAPAIQQTYTLYATLFYHEPPPESFTATR